MTWIVFRNQAQAIQCRNLLAQNGIIGQLGKPPQIDSDQVSGMWAVGIHWEEQRKGRQVCRIHGIQPSAWIDGAEGIL